MMLIFCHCHALTNLVDSYSLSITQAESMERTGQLTGVSTDPDFQYEEGPVDAEQQEHPDAEMDKAKGILLKAALKRREAKNKKEVLPPQVSEQGTY